MKESLYGIHASINAYAQGELATSANHKKDQNIIGTFFLDWIQSRVACLLFVVAVKTVRVSNAPLSLLGNVTSHQDLSVIEISLHVG